MSEKKPADLFFLSPKSTGENVVAELLRHRLFLCPGVSLTSVKRFVLDQARAVYVSDLLRSGLVVPSVDLSPREPSRAELAAAEADAHAMTLAEVLR